MKLSRVASLFCEEPYRLFFPLGILIGLVGVSQWSLYALGWLEAYPGDSHPSIQVQAYMASFVLGFMLTALPRFASAPRARWWEVLTFLILTLTMFGSLIFNHRVAAEICFIGWLVALASFVAIRFLNRAGETVGVGPPTNFVWIPVAVITGITGNVLLILGQMELAPGWTIGVGKPMAEQGFLLSIVVGIGGFLAPRLMGIYKMPKPSEIPSQNIVSRYRIYGVIVHLIAAVLLFGSFWLEGLGLTFWGYLLRAVVVTGELIWNKAIPFPPKMSGIYAWLLWLSMWMVALGCWAQMLFPIYRKEMLHLVFIGGFSLMAFSVATVVTLSHSGEAKALQRQLWALWVVAVGLTVALGLRVISGLPIAVHIGINYFAILGIAAGFWTIAAVCWLCFIAPKVLRVPNAGEFERQHELAKQRLLDAK